MTSDESNCCAMVPTPSSGRVIRPGPNDAKGWSKAFVRSRFVPEAVGRVVGYYAATESAPPHVDVIWADVGRLADQQLYSLHCISEQEYLDAVAPWYSRGSGLFWG